MKRTLREPPDLSASTLTYIGDGHYVDKATGMVLARLGRIHSTGYEKVHHDGREQFGHRLVFAALHGPIPPRLTINHRDGNKANNHPDNVELASESEQRVHAWRVLDAYKDRDQRGERHPMAKLTNEQVALLREPDAQVAQLCREFGITKNHGHKIRRGDVWKS